MLLDARSLNVHYGPLHAVRGVDMGVPPGSIVGLLGANGSGKSSILKAVSGLHKPSSGEVRFDGRRIDPLPTASIIRLGVSHVLDGRRLFNDMTVEQNLEMGAYTRKDGKAAVRADIDRMFERFPQLRDKRGKLARELSGGVQEILAIARALMARPSLIMMDEPCQGLAPRVIEELEETIRSLNAEGMAILVVEHNVRFALSLCSQVHILESGALIFSGAPGDLSEAEFVQKIYLGG